MRAIDADALIDDLELMYEHRDDKDEPYNIGVRGAINMTRKAPTIEPKRGEWILECDGEGECDNLYRCSECGCEYGCQEYDIPNFCPNCGADMREREGE